MKARKKARRMMELIITDIENRPGLWPAWQAIGLQSRSAARERWLRIAAPWFDDDPPEGATR